MNITDKMAAFFRRHGSLKNQKKNKNDAYLQTYAATNNPDNPSVTTQTIFVKANSSKYLDGVVFEKVPGDGNCFYHAVIKALNNKSEQYNHSKLRQMVANYWENPEQAELLEYALTPIYLEKHNSTNEVTKDTMLKCIEHLKKDGVFADEHSIVALSNILKRPIVVMEYDSDKQPKIRTVTGNDNPTESDEPIFVHFDEKREHYSALIVQEGYSGKEILQKLQYPNKRQKI